MNFNNIIAYNVFDYKRRAGAVLKIFSVKRVIIFAYKLNLAVIYGRLNRIMKFGGVLHL